MNSYKKQTTGGTMTDNSFDLKEGIERIYKENFEDSKGISLYKDRRTIYSKGIELIANKDDRPYCDCQSAKYCDPHNLQKYLRISCQ